MQQTYSPIDNSLIDERPYPSIAEIDAVVARAQRAQHSWAKVPLSDKQVLIARFAELSLAQRDAMGEEITRQMGRPIRYTPNEVTTMTARAATMAEFAERALADIELAPRDGFTRFIRREPIGIVLAIMPWNYPYLTAVNVVIPALLAGNAVILKPSPHTPLCGDRLAKLFEDAGLPEGVFQVLHLSPSQTDELVQRNEIGFVAFTGSVQVGHLVQKAASNRFVGVGLELGGKDAAYVRADADLGYAAENLIDGALFNSGQSCCAIERIYVQRDVYQEFVEHAVDVARGYVLGDPFLPETTLGPVVRVSSAEFIRCQIAEAVSQGAEALIDPGLFPAAKPDSTYVAPQILVRVNHEMRVMTEETFGPVVGIMPVDTDEHAIELMNDSRFGLTGSIWSKDVVVAQAIGERLEVGTVFLNRCDYLDPELAWVGVKDSGRGCMLSELGFSHLTRPKSFHLKTKT